MKNWLLYVFALAFSAYWASNLLLWFPWSISTTLGITLMLTVAPLIWAYATYLGLTTHPPRSPWISASIISGILLLVAVVMDFVFFGLIRGAMEELYHPTTFYGYGFLIFWPFALALIFRKRIRNSAATLKTSALAKATSVGLVCLLLLSLIILLDIKI